MRPALQNLSISLVTLVIGYAAIEAYFAATYRPGLSTMNASVRFESFTPPINDDGFRQRPFDARLFDEGAVRILFLGDSYTFGYGVADGDARFPDMLATRINQATTDGRRYYVYNAGVSGTEPTRCVG